MMPNQWQFPIGGTKDARKNLITSNEETSGGI